MSTPRLEYVTKWEGLKDRIRSSKGYERVNAVVARIPRNSLWIPDSLRSDLEPATVAAIVDSHDTAQKSALVESYYLQQKSYHGNKQISFSVFEDARQSCLSACAVVRVGNDEPHGSAVLVGDNLVLTCGHNFIGDLGPANSCRLLFHFTDKDRGAFYKIAQEYYRSDALDFCLLELGDLIRAADDPNFQLPKPPRLGVEPEVERNKGIYVAGFPGGHSLSVALNSQIVYPFWMEHQEDIDQLAQTALLRLFTSPAEYEINHLTFADRVKRFFSASYKSAGKSGFHFKPAGFPTIGADPDTKHGNSGGPAFDISRNSLIGILRSGVRDDVELPEGANYANYELLIPISQIVAELDAKMPGWKSTFGVTFTGDIN